MKGDFEQTDDGCKLSDDVLDELADDKLQGVSSEYCCQVYH